MNGKDIEKIKSNEAVFREKKDPTEGHRPQIAIAFFLFFYISMFGTVYFIFYTGDFRFLDGDMRSISSKPNAPSYMKLKNETKAPSRSQTTSSRDGPTIFSSICQACHQANAQGLAGVFPPLADSNWVSGNPDRLILVVLHGLEGPIEVNGKPYNGVMPAHAEQLNNKELASIINHIRTSWGNQFSKISSEKVAELRKKYSSRNKAWSQVELDNFKP